MAAQGLPPAPGTGSRAGGATDSAAAGAALSGAASSRNSKWLHPSTPPSGAGYLVITPPPWSPPFVGVEHYLLYHVPPCARAGCVACFTFVGARRAVPRGSAAAPAWRGIRPGPAPAQGTARRAPTTPGVVAHSRADYASAPP